MEGQIEAARNEVKSLGSQYIGNYLYTRSLHSWFSVKKNISQLWRD